MKATAKAAWPTCSSTCCSKAPRSAESELIQLRNQGASFNGTTSYDRTNYFETMTATDDNLRWALEMEADRMVNSRGLAKRSG